jgi:hypothetical protein
MSRKPWYDIGVNNAILDLNDEHPNATAIFGGALYAYEYVKDSYPDLDGFVTYLPHVAQTAKLLNWHEGVEGALRTFCHLCYLDPELVELYLGVHFCDLYS